MDQRENTGFLVSRGVKVALGVAVGAAVLTGVAYFFFQQEQQNSPAQGGHAQGGHVHGQQGCCGNVTANTSTSTHQSSGGLSSRDPRYVNTITALKPAVQRDLSNGSLSAQTIMGINQAMTLVAEKSYASAVTENRSARRAIRTTDPAEYTRLVEQGTQQIETVINDALTQTLTDLGCTLQQYEHSNQIIAQSNPQFPLMSLLMIERMKSNIPSTRDLNALTAEKAKEMIKFQIESYPNIDIEVQNPQMAALVKQSYMGDMTFEKFGYEEEDFAQLGQLGQDPEFQNLVRQLQGLIQSDAMQAMGGGDMGGMPGMPGMY